MTDRPREAAEYALGYSEREKQRLVIQSRFYGDLTERLFRMAGIQPGMSVLDVGCGVGDVSVLAAAMVGPAGSVLGVDRAADSIETARARPSGGAGERRIRGRSLAESRPRPDVRRPGRPPRAHVPSRPGRHARPPPDVRPPRRTRRLPGNGDEPGPLRSAGAAVPDMPGRDPRDVPAGGIRDRHGLAAVSDLPASRPSPSRARMEGRVEGGPGSAAYELLAETVRSLVPMIERLGVATSSEFEVDTLAARMEAETFAGGGVIMPPPMIGAWVRKAG